MSNVGGFIRIDTGMLDNHFIRGGLEFAVAALHQIGKQEILFKGKIQKPTAGQLNTGKHIEGTFKGLDDTLPDEERFVFETPGQHKRNCSGQIAEFAIRRDGKLNVLRLKFEIILQQFHQTLT